MLVRAVYHRARPVLSVQRSNPSGARAVLGGGVVASQLQNVTRWSRSFAQQPPLQTSQKEEAEAHASASIMSALSQRIGQHTLNHQKQAPFVTLTYAQSLDGSIMRRTVEEERLLLSGAESTIMTHQLRAMHDTILVGVGTVLADDPLLTVRLKDQEEGEGEGEKKHRHPLPVVLDPNLRTPLLSRLVQSAGVGKGSPDSGVGLIVVTTDEMDSAKLARKQLLDAQPGVLVITVATKEGHHRGQIPLAETLALLKQLCGSQSVMVEGGAKVLGSFFSQPELSDFLVVTTAPRFVGGIGPVVSPFNDLRLADVHTCRLGDDTVICGHLQSLCPTERETSSSSSSAAATTTLRVVQEGQVLPRLVSDCRMWVDLIHTECRLQIYECAPSLALRVPQQQELVVLVKGEVMHKENVPVRIHSECFTGDILGSKRCDCGEQLQGFLKVLDSVEHGVLVYAKGHEGRGIGLGNKIKVYKLQDEEHLDTVDSNLRAGFAVDARHFDDSVSVLKEQLGIRSVNLYSNNPEKAKALGPLIANVVPMVTIPHDVNRGYLQTKRDRLNHSTLMPQTR